MRKLSVSFALSTKISSRIAILLYNRQRKIDADGFYHNLEFLCTTCSALQIMKVVRLNCPLEIYPDVEHFLARMCGMLR